MSASTAAAGKATERFTVVHAGALGDGVVLWPLLRALKRAGHRVRFVATGSRAALAGRELGVEFESVDGARWSALWRSDRDDDGAWSAADACDVVLTALADERDERGRVWFENVRRATGAREVTSLGVHGSAERSAVFARFGVGATGLDAGTRANRGRAVVVMHIGAGSEAKRWAVERWIELRAALVGRGLVVRLVAGEVERERVSGREWRMLEKSGASVELPADVLVLADVLKGAGVYVGADSGPTHLAAELGVPTVALFGPTDPRVWGPRGAVVIAPAEQTADMSWLSAAEVARSVSALL